jgi:8-oxo-dGTP diphosphatase
LFLSPAVHGQSISIATVEVTRISAYALLIERDHLLLCRLSGDMLHAGMWTLPGGGIEFGEDPEAAMIREVEEETGLRVSAAGLAGIHSFTHDTPGRSFHGIRIVYYADVIDGVLRYEQDGTTDMCRWHALDTLETLGLVELVEAALPMLRRGAPAPGQ